MKIAGFNVSKKFLIAVIIFIVAVFGISKYSSYKNEQEIARRNAEAMANSYVPQDDTPVLSYNEQLQIALTEQFGVAPEGFIWGYTGNLIAIGEDGLTAEEVVYTFLRSISMLDFATASRYSTNSVVIRNYQDYFGITSSIITDYYTNFVRKQYKESLGSLEALGTGDVSVFNDGTQYVTVYVRALDLTDKDFWLDDRDELFETMYAYKSTESDDAKMETYLYDYILSKYADGSIGKREAQIELVVAKEHDGGWLITNDKELDAILEYENGLDVARYILNDFNTWYIEESLKRNLNY